MSEGNGARAETAPAAGQGGESRTSLPDAEYVRKELLIRDVAQALAFEVQGRRLRCPLDRSHWASFWLRKNMVKCFRCRHRPWSTIDLVMETLQISMPDALRWLAERFKVPHRWRRRTRSRWGKTHSVLVDYPRCRRPKCLMPDIQELRRASGWPCLSQGARLLAGVLLETIPCHTPVVTTSQEKLRQLAGISNRGTVKNALRQLEAIGLIATAREAMNREARTGRFTTALCVRLSWGSPAFQDWLRATKYKCSKLNTVKCANRHVIEHGDAAHGRERSEQVKPKKRAFEVRSGVGSLTDFGQIVAHFAGKGGDFQEIVQSSVKWATEQRILLPPHPEQEAGRILREKR
jgi:hypothetical protein